MKSNHTLLPSYLDDSLISEILSIGEKQPWRAGMVGSDGFGTHNTGIRSVDLINIDAYYHPQLYNILKHAIEVFNVTTDRNYSITGINQIDLLHYKSGGHYDFHKDIGEGNSQHERKVSCIAQLSDPDDYEGGDFVLAGEDISIDEKAVRRRQGTLILFDSRSSHQITPITKGERYSLIAWGVGRV